MGPGPLEGLIIMMKVRSGWEVILGVVSGNLLNRVGNVDLRCVERVPASRVGVDVQGDEDARAKWRAAFPTEHDG